jgi:hypothetical protein
MRVSAVMSAVFFLSATGFLCGSGCTNIDNPVREEETAELVITAGMTEVLDTEPVRLEALGGSGTIAWETEPQAFGSFSPDGDKSVVYSPPDVDGTVAVTITARDDTGRSSTVQITVIDEGPPPSPGDILLNEIAWAGTLTSSYDEYIEIINSTERPFFLPFWKIENAAGSGTPLVFSGRIQKNGVFLIANYPSESEKTAITCRIDFTDSAVSLSNTFFGPFILKDSHGSTFDTVGDGGDYTDNLKGDKKPSLSRYTYAGTPGWDGDSWYTEGTSVNLSDGTFGTPGAENSDTPLYTGPGEDDALAIITEFGVNTDEEIGEDWVELLITRSGNLKNLVVTDLDADDSSISGGEDVWEEAGTYILVVWSDEAFIEGNTFYISDTDLPGTKDEIALMCGNTFIDGLCYSVDDKLPDDYEDLCVYGWEGDPIGSLSASRRTEDGGSGYMTAMIPASWDASASSSPGEKNW